MKACWRNVGVRMRTLLFITGWFATALGAAGVFLPVVPTTPFLLLAAACFARSSPRAERWLLDSRWLGPILRDYLQHRAVPVRAKVLALVMLWPSVGWTATQVVPVPAVGIGLVLIALVITGYLLRLPSPERSARKTPT